MTEIHLLPLEEPDREQFIKDNQEAFRYGALEEFGLRDDHFEEEDEIISRSTIEQSINEGTAYRIVQNGKNVGGAVIKTEYDHGELELLFVSPAVHSKGIGYAAWCEIEDMHPEVTVSSEAVQEQIKRVKYYEDIMQKAQDMDNVSHELHEMLKKLRDYYVSDAWKRDFSSDEAGLLPKELKRGVLSQDGIYDLLEKYDM